LSESLTINLSKSLTNNLSKSLTFGWPMNKFNLSRFKYNQLHQPEIVICNLSLSKSRKFYFEFLSKSLICSWQRQWLFNDSCWNSVVAAALWSWICEVWLLSLPSLWFFILSLSKSLTFYFELGQVFGLLFAIVQITQFLCFCQILADNKK